MYIARAFAGRLIGPAYKLMIAVSTFISQAAQGLTTDSRLSQPRHLGKHIRRDIGIVDWINCRPDD